MQDYDITSINISQQQCSIWAKSTKLAGLTTTTPPKSPSNTTKKVCRPFHKSPRNPPKNSAKWSLMERSSPSRHGKLPTKPPIKYWSTLKRNYLARMTRNWPSKEWEWSEYTTSSGIPILQCPWTSSISTASKPPHRWPPHSWSLYSQGLRLHCW